MGGEEGPSVATPAPGEEEAGTGFGVAELADDAGAGACDGRGWGAPAACCAPGAILLKILRSISVGVTPAPPVAGLPPKLTPAKVPGNENGPTARRGGGGCCGVRVVGA